MGRSITTAVLLVTAPKKYGIINGITEDVLRNINFQPNRLSKGKDMEKINGEVFLSLSFNLNVDLWTLEALW